MATPEDLEDFAIGFLLTEGLIGSARDVVDLEIVDQSLGVEARLWLKPELMSGLMERRRRMVGPTGCGLCGIESLTEATRPARRVEGQADLGLRPEQILSALAELESAQPLGDRTRAVHAAGFWRPERGLIAVREDVGRHNALDKLAGALALAGEAGAAGVVILTSRVSVEMVQKTCAVGASVLIAVSAPTTLAVDMAKAAGLTLVGVARPDGFEVFCDAAGRVDFGQM